MRRFLAILFVVPALGAAPAQAGDRVGVQAKPWLDVSSVHFIVHFAPGFDPAVAQKVAAWGDDAYAREVSWGYPVPKNDGDSKVDVYIDDIADRSVAGYAHVDRDTTSDASGWIELDTTRGTASESTIAHELFHVIQFAMIVKSLGFATEATANWAASLVTGTGELTHWGDHDSLDCLGTQCGDALGYSRWSYFRFLSDRYGVGIVRDMWMQPTEDPIAALEAVLAKRGTSVEREFVAFENATLDKRSPQFPYLEPKVGAPATMRLELPRLASAPPTVEESTPADGELCRAGVLHMSVSTGSPNVTVAYRRLPAGQPVLLPLTDGVATFDVPWRSCLTGDVVVIVVNGGLTSARVTLTASFTPVDEPTPVVQIIPSSKPTIRNTGINLEFHSSGFGAVEVLVAGYPAVTTGRFEVFGDTMTRWFTFGRRLKAGRYTLVATPISTAGTLGTPIRVSFVVARA